MFFDRKNFDTKMGDACLGFGGKEKDKRHRGKRNRKIERQEAKRQREWK